MPICRICKQQLHPKTTPENVEWCMPSKNYYYHVKCYKEWKADLPSDEELASWITRITSFLGQDLKVSYNFKKCEQQIKKYVESKKYTPKGIYFALKYFYEVKKNSWDKSNGGIGIVPYVYDESREYWTEQERKQKGFMEALEKQLQERQNREVVKIKRPQNKKEKIKYRLKDVGGEDGR